MHKNAILTLGMSAVFVLASCSVRAQDVLVDASGQNQGALTNALKFGGPEPQDFLCITRVGIGAPPPNCPTVPTGEGIVSPRVSPPHLASQPIKPPNNQYGLDLITDNLPRLSVTHAGLIGIGTQTPAYTLHLQHAGDVQVGLASTDAGHRLWTIQSSGMTDPARAGTFQIIDRDQNLQRLGIDANGIVTVNSLQITGGSDLAEPFATVTAIAPGSVVVIDAAHPDQLVLSHGAYDRHVAGIVSGANAVRPGLTLEQLGAGKEQVALSGRVYAMCDASNGPIEPGDLLTTSATAGHAMKATNMHRAQGAILGKALGSLQHGSGMVLLLVSLQ